MDFYAPKGKLLWDSWFINQGDLCHIFHLQADPSDDSEKRHNNGVSIGHAVSKDYIHWEELPTALEPGTGSEWDNKDLWSGCVKEKDGLYYMYYTGKNNSPGMENIQKICLAVSRDLSTWTKHPNNPIVECDTRYYDMDNKKNSIGRIGAWRDPFVFKDPNSQKRYMSISARARGANTQYNGCVALAESKDMINWEVLPPIFSPNVYDEIEATCIVYHKGFYYLFFTTHASNYLPSFAREHGAHGGLHCYYSENLFGNYKPVNQNGVVFNNGHEIYDIRVLKIGGDDFIGIGWLNFDSEEKFVGKLSRPIKIQIEQDRVFGLL